LNSHFRAPRRRPGRPHNPRNSCANHAGIWGRAGAPGAVFLLAWDDLVCVGCHRGWRPPRRRRRHSVC